MLITFLKITLYYWFCEKSIENFDKKNPWKRIYYFEDNTLVVIFLIIFFNCLFSEKTKNVKNLLQNYKISTLMDVWIVILSEHPLTYCIVQFITASAVGLS